MTDSGGIQEKAPAFGCPVLILRDTTERIEGVNAGYPKLVGADPEIIFKEAKAIIEKPYDETRLSIEDNPYGDGTARIKICEILKNYYKNDESKVFSI